ncbi:Rpn family recombination-promoting nuclease/putative transposase [Chitinophaga oryziterrae]|uniref:Rpn family recombination-promoting nuclease/putative transposase n=1 Tax=Chitinophaga oryziterrae TaxID=1031224 RepID=UPI0031CE3CF5
MAIESHANQYDKIFKENMEYALPGIIKNILGLTIMHTEEISHDLQHTKERKPDVLRKVTDQNNRTYILHVELQSQNEKDMVYRMVEYRVMLQRKHRLPVKQYVLFVGKGRLTMLSSIDEEDFKFRYNIVSPQQIDYKIFLKSKWPEEKILAILADFGEDEPKKVIEAIMDGVKITAEGEETENKYLTQLRILLQLRSLDKKYTEMISVASFFKEEKDFLYIRGKEIGEAEGEKKGKKKGEKKNKKKTALKMKERGLELSLISDITELPIKAIEKL